MSKVKYVPKRGDVIYLDFSPHSSPHSGHEQAGRRPALVLSPADYNRPIKLAIVCPITNQAKGYPFEVPIPANSYISGVVLADQIKCLDWEGRKAEYICALDEALLEEVVQKLLPLLHPPSEED